MACAQTGKLFEDKGAGESFSINTSGVTVVMPPARTAPCGVS
jgi:hypothetical protein